MDIHRTNNFDFLRFYGAASIIISHCFALSLGYTAISIYNPTLLFGQIGLAVLIVISGFLIPASWERDPRPKAFFTKRLLRIGPGLIFAILFVLFIIGPIATTLPLAEYFAAMLSPSTWASVPFYTNGAALGLFTTNPVPFVNAPLWAIPLEFSLYILLAGLGLVGLLKFRHTMIPLFLFFFILWALWFENPTLSKVHYILYFLAGAWYFRNRDRIDINGRTALVLFVVLAGTYLFFPTNPVIFPVAFLVIPYLVLFVAQVDTPRLNHFGKYGDFSYGMFIFTYPIQQTMILFWPGEVCIPLLIVFSLAAGVGMGAVSWHLVEKRTLGLKRRVTGKS